MSASSREDRRQAVCGGKPGGKEAYYFKETCASKNTINRASEANTKRKTDTKRLKKYDAYLEFVKKDFLRIRSRDKFLASRPVQPHIPFVGAEHAVASIFIRDAVANKDYSIYSRIGTAVQEFNRSQKALKKKVVFNYTLERLVIMAVSNHYAGVLNVLAPIAK